MGDENPVFVKTTTAGQTSYLLVRKYFDHNSGCTGLLRKENSRSQGGFENVRGFRNNGGSTHARAGKTGGGGAVQKEVGKKSVSKNNQASKQAEYKQG